MKKLIRWSLLLFAASWIAEGSTVTTAEWTSDADLPLDSEGIYSHLINLDPTAGDLTVNSHVLVPSSGETNTYTIYRGSWWEFSGMSSSVSGTTKIEMGFVSGDATNLISRLSYKNETSPSIKLCGLAPGAHYRMSLISVGWDISTTSRTQALTVNGDPLESINGSSTNSTITPNEFGIGHGFVLSLDYTASDDGDIELVLTPTATAPMVVGAVINQLLDPFEPHQFEMGYEEPAGIRIIPYNKDWVPRFSSQATRASWALSRSRMDFYLVTRGIARDIRQSSAADQEEIYAFLRERVICFDDISMTQNGLDGDRADAEHIFDDIVDDMEQFYTNGVSVSCLLMQSTMSRGAQTYSAAERVEDSTYFAQYMDAQLAARGIPLPSYGLIDASRAKFYSNWQTLLSSWVAGMNAIGRPPVMIVQDYPSSIVLGNGSAQALLDVMAYTVNTLGLKSYWWIAGGTDVNDGGDLTPLEGRNYMINSMSSYFALSGAAAVTTGLLFGDFHYIYSSDTPDRMDGPSYSALEVLNEIYNKALRYQTSPALPDSSAYAGWVSRMLGSWSPSADGEDDPDGDGVNNAFEYFLGTHPYVADADWSGLPKITGTDSESGSLLFEYTRSGNADDASLRFLAADSLTHSTWSTRVPGSDWTVQSQVSNADGTVTVTIAVPLSGTQEFFKTGVETSSE